MDDTYKNFGDKVVNGEIDRKNRHQDQQLIDQSLIMAGRDSQTNLGERVREIFEQIRKHKDGTEDTEVIPPPDKPPTTPKFKCKSNQDCWDYHKSNQYYCNKGTGECIKCPNGSHGKKDDTAECCRDEPIPGPAEKPQYYIIKKTASGIWHWKNFICTETIYEVFSCRKSDFQGMYKKIESNWNNKNQTCKEKGCDRGALYKRIWRPQTWSVSKHQGPIEKRPKEIPKDERKCTGSMTY